MAWRSLRSRAASGSSSSSADGLVHQRARERDALLLAAGELRRAALGEVAHADDLEHLADRLGDLAPSGPCGCAARRPRCRTRSCAGTARTAGTRCSRCAGTGGVRDTSSPSRRMRPVGGRLEPGDHPQRGGLAAARRAEHREELAPPDRRSRRRARPRSRRTAWRRDRARSRRPRRIAGRHPASPHRGARRRPTESVARPADRNRILRVRYPKRVIHRSGDGALASIAADGHTARRGLPGPGAVAGHRDAAPGGHRRSSRVRPTSWSSAAATAGCRRPPSWLARGRSVAVLDAHDLGWGASTRNGGMVLPELKAGPALARARATASSASACTQEVEAAFDHVEALDRRRLDRLRLRAHRPAVPVARRRGRGRTSTRSAAELTSVGSPAHVVRGDDLARRDRLDACSRPGSWWSAAAGSTRPGSTPASRGVADEDRRVAPPAHPGHRRRRRRRRLAGRRRPAATSTPATCWWPPTPTPTRSCRRSAAGCCPMGSFIIATEPLAPDLAEAVLPTAAHVLQRPQPPLVLAPRRRGPDGVRGPEAARQRDPGGGARPPLPVDGRGPPPARRHAGRAGVGRPGRPHPRPAPPLRPDRRALVRDRLQRLRRRAQHLARPPHGRPPSTASRSLPSPSSGTARSPCTRCGGRGCRWCRPGSASRTGEQHEDPRGRQRRGGLGLRHDRPTPRRSSSRWCWPTSTRVAPVTAAEKTGDPRFIGTAIDASDRAAVAECAAAHGATHVLNAADPRFVMPIFGGAFDAGADLPRHGDVAVASPPGATARGARREARRRAVRRGRRMGGARAARPGRRSASSPGCPMCSLATPPTSSSARSTSAACATAPTSSWTATPSRPRSRSGRRSRSASTRR